MAEERVAAAMVRPAGPSEADGEAASGGDIWRWPADRSADRLDLANREILQATRRMLTRIISLLR